jgi:hypothetical protein
MNTKLRRSVLFFFVVIVLAATAIAATLSDQGRSSTRTHDQASQSSALASPIILAQGRCYNGRCY